MADAAVAESDARPLVLVVGATGHVGKQVVSQLLAKNKYRIRAMVRNPANANALAEMGVELLQGDMMKRETLLPAFQGAYAVISCAAGYTGHSKGDSHAIDREGNRNLVDAAAQTSGLNRFVLLSILHCELASATPHFWDKFQWEEYCAEKKVPFVAIRPGAFLDQGQRDFIGDGIRKGSFMNIFGDATVSWMYTADLARFLADAVDAPETIIGKRINVGYDRPGVTYPELVNIISRLNGTTYKLGGPPQGLLSCLIAIASKVSTSANDMRQMILFFKTGQYVLTPADKELQEEYFGPVASFEEAVKRFLSDKGLLKTTAGAAQ
eukprot:TRINITY_DN4922_c0_g1_i1.p1 TRINITY_DN4922_c0_g1~~TRINITY_DN4922_c0_g1_i1.p1  ORF type:complete len:324 (-),score=69.00 TRINITY_DN4922_c0_g1_i1:169-1140(-)